MLNLPMIPAVVPINVPQEDRPAGSRPSSAVPLIESPKYLRIAVKSPRWSWVPKGALIKQKESERIKKGGRMQYRRSPSVVPDAQVV